MYFKKFSTVKNIFLGGPGSLKGVLTQELSQEFEFVTINVEDIVFSYLPNKVANTVKTIVEQQELIRVSFIYSQEGGGVCI